MDSKYKRLFGSFTPDMIQLFDLLVEHYTEEWLNTKGNNRIQILWNRPDEVSTYELYSLSACIQNMLTVDENWTRKQIQKSKDENDNNSRGAIFELCSLGMLNNSKNPVKTVKDNNAGYDGCILLGQNKELRVSIKNYGKSERQRDFEMYAGYVDEIIQPLLKKYDYPPIQIIIDCASEYPITSDWLYLINHLDNIFQTKRDLSVPSHNLIKNYSIGGKILDCIIWTVIIQPMKDGTEMFHPHFKSYSLIIAGKYHKNEGRNINSKIKKACENLIKHSCSESEFCKNAIVIHLPPSVNIEQCYTWVENYFVENPNTPISLVLLYQPSIARDLETGNFSLAHISRTVNRLDAMQSKLYNFEMTIYCGVPGKNTRLIFGTYYPDGKIETFDLDGRYLYQHGEHYLRTSVDEQGNFSATISTPSSGIHIKRVVENINQKKYTVFSGNFHPSDELLIL